MNEHGRAQYRYVTGLAKHAVSTGYARWSMLAFLIAYRYIMELVTEGGGRCDVSLFFSRLLFMMMMMVMMVRLVDVCMQCGEINHKQPSR